MSVLIERVYRCPICRVAYDSLAQAERCEARGAERARFVVGDIVLAGAGFGWFDGDPRWVANFSRLGGTRDQVLQRGICPHDTDNCFSDCCTYAFYYVVTVVDVDERDGHRVRYHVFTKAMTGAQGYRSGYTFNSGHVGLRHVAPSRATFVRRDAIDLRGSRSDTLL